MIYFVIAFCAFWWIYVAGDFSGWMRYKAPDDPAKPPPPARLFLLSFAWPLLLVGLLVGEQRLDRFVSWFLGDNR
jgi:hypothetical protein